tara:strand:- start:513 stop:692 length:180 start_codon:yes stop_codon:yes gene_type:complete
MKVGDLVRYKDVKNDTHRIGFITDALEDDTGWYMYEVVCTDPYDRGWYSDLALEVVLEK